MSQCIFAWLFNCFFVFTSFAWQLVLLLVKPKRTAWALFSCTVWCIYFRTRLQSCVCSGLLQDSVNGRLSKGVQIFSRYFQLLEAFLGECKDSACCLWGGCWYSTHRCTFNGNICSTTKWQWIQKDGFGLNRGCYPLQWKPNSAKAHCADNCWKTALRGRR